MRTAAAVGSRLPADALGKLQPLDHFGQVFGEVTEAFGFRPASQQTLLEREFERQGVGQVEAGLRHRSLGLDWLELEQFGYFVRQIESVLKPFRVGRRLRSVLEVFDSGLEAGQSFVERDGCKPLPAAGLYIEAPVVIAVCYALHDRRTTNRRKLPSGLQDDTEFGMTINSLPDHQPVALLEDVKRQLGAGKQDDFERKQRQRIFAGHATLLLLVRRQATAVQIKGRTVFLTGASSGVGRACARLFAAEGAQLILTARSSDRLEAVAREVHPAQAMVIPADLEDPSSISALCDQTSRRVSAIDILINNAGVGLYAPSFEAPPELVRRLFALNLLAPVELVRRLRPLIPRGGAIVNISSIAGKVPLPWLPLYSSSKCALNAFSDALRMELGAAGIHVLSVCPGYVDTPFRDNALQGAIPEKVAGQRRFMITAEQCAQAILEGLRQDQRTVVTPRIGWVLVALARLFPGALYRRLAKMNRAATAPDREP